MNVRCLLGRHDWRKVVGTQGMRKARRDKAILGLLYGHAMVDADSPTEYELCSRCKARR